LIFERFYSCWDIPRTQLATLRAVVNRGEPAVVRLFDAYQLREEIEEIIRGSRVIVVLVDSKDPLQIEIYKQARCGGLIVGKREVITDDDYCDDCKKGRKK
jgi:hypothetical protein